MIGPTSASCNGSGEEALARPVAISPPKQERRLGSRLTDPFYRVCYTTCQLSGSFYFRPHPAHAWL